MTTKFNGRERRMKIGGGDAYSKGAYIDLELNVPRNANVKLSTGDAGVVPWAALFALAVFLPTCKPLR